MIFFTHEVIKLDFLEKLNYLMEIHGLNKNTLSKSCDIPYTTIDNWYKRGYDGLKLTTLKKLSSFFGVSLDFWIQEKIPIKAKKSPEPTDLYSEDLHPLLKIYEQLNVDGQNRLMEYAQDLAEMPKYKKCPDISQKAIG